MLKHCLGNAQTLHAHHDWNALASEHVKICGRWSGEGTCKTAN
jgi:hypothetical protein